MRAMKRAARTVAAAVVAVMFLTVPAMGSATGIIATKADEFNPAATDTYIAWNVYVHKHYVVYAKQFGGTRFRVNPKGTQAWVGSIDGTTLTYQQFSFSTNTSDIYTYDLGTNARAKIGSPVSTSRWEYDGSASGEWVMFARYYRNDDRKIFLYNTTTLELRPLAATSGRRWQLRADQINGNYAVWEKVLVRHGQLAGCNIFLYDILGATATKLDNPNERCQYAAAVNPVGTVYFARSGFGCGRNVFLRQEPLGASATTIVNFADNHDVSNLYALDNGDTTTDVYYDPYRCGGSYQADIVKVTEP